jgi:hypothetical protein
MASWARRLFRRDFDVLRFGTAPIAHILSLHEIPWLEAGWTLPFIPIQKTSGHRAAGKYYSLGAPPVKSRKTGKQVLMRPERFMFPGHRL